MQTSEKIISNFKLVEVFENEPRISHKIIAKNTENKEVSVRNLINKYFSNFEVFGRLHFKNEVEKENNQGGLKPKTFYLNEQQATLLLTFMRNNEIVINFKVRLVKEFFEMRQFLLKPKSQPAKTPQTFDLDSYISENEKLIKLIKLITSEDQITLHYLDKLTKQLNLKSPLDLLEIDLNSFYFIPTELGKFFNKSAVEINKILESKGFQIKINGVWQLTETGKNYAIQLDNNFLTIKWKLESLV